MTTNNNAPTTAANGEVSRTALKEAVARITTPTKGKPPKVATKKAAPKAKAKAKVATKKAAKPATEAKPKADPKGDKVADLVAALKKPAGLTPDEAGKLLDCSMRYARRLIFRVVRKAMKLKVVVKADEKRGNVYRIEA